MTEECCRTDDTTGNMTIRLNITCKTVICPYKHKCVSYPNRCNTCKHNMTKRDYYEPEPSPPYYPPFDPYPWIPYPPYYPWYPDPYPYTPWITWWTTCDDWNSGNYTNNTQYNYYCSCE